MQNNRVYGKISSSRLVMLPAVIFYAGLIGWLLLNADNRDASKQGAAVVVPMEATETTTVADHSGPDPDTKQDNTVTLNSVAGSDNAVHNPSPGETKTSGIDFLSQSTQPTTHNTPSTESQTPDSDEDGVADHSDLCPDSPGVAGNRGCPADTDSDGLPDVQDQCPEQAGDLSFGGCPADSDADGMPDDSDYCPNTAGEITTNGCPAEIATLKTIASEIAFESASSRLTDKSKAILTKAARMLVRYPQISLTVAGHTDDQGDETINLKLSEQRARACVNYLANQGIDAKRMTAVGYGETRPLVPNNTADARKQNRRVEFILG